MLKEGAWLWAASAHVCDGDGLRNIVRRLRFVTRALAAYDAVQPFIEAAPESPLGRLLEQRPETVGAVVWPYQCLAWDARTRLGRIREHYRAIEALGGRIGFSVNGRVRLLDLTGIRPGLSVVLDQPQWFMREGQLTINLFLDETRVYSLVFSLFSKGDVLCAFVGAIQGRDIDGILDEYRNLTKNAHGMRPRDLLIELFRMFCSVIGVERILAIKDAQRQHRSSYYGESGKSKLSVDYDEIWRDRGGSPVDEISYELDVCMKERELESIPAKKRSMYRRRYEMLRSLSEQMKKCWGEAAGYDEERHRETT